MFKVKLYIFLIVVFLQTYVYGQVLDWAHSIGSPNTDVGISIAIDSDGNVYSTGGFAGIIDFDLDTSNLILSSLGSRDAFVTKHDKEGKLVWAKSFGGPGTEDGYKIELDNIGNVIIIGNFYFTVDFDPGIDTVFRTANGTTGKADVFVCKFDNDGNFLWVNTFGSTDIDFGRNLTIDNTNNIYVTGFVSGIADFNPSIDTVNHIFYGSRDIFVVKYSPEGEYIWSFPLGNENYDYGLWQEVDKDNNLIISGYYSGTVDFNPDTNITNTLTSTNNSQDVFVAKYDSTGSLLWANNIGGESSIGINCLSIDNFDNIYVTGGFEDTLHVFGTSSTEEIAISNNSNNFYLTKFLKTGEALWVKSSQGDSIEGINATYIVDNYIYATGFFFGITDLDFDTAQATFTSKGNADIFISRYDLNGVFDWAISMGNTNEDRGRAIVASNNNEVYTIGWYRSDSIEYAHENIFVNQGSQDIYIAKFIPCNVKIDSLLKSDVTCFNSNDGEIDIYVSGGYPPYNFIWSNDSTTQSISDLTEGVYYVTIDDSYICSFVDSVEILQPELILENAFESICEGDSIYLDNAWQIESGIYYDTLVNSLGCDSIIITELTVYTASNFQFSVSICDGDSYNFGTANYSAAGIYYDTLQTENGCDSIIVLNLSVNPISSIQLQTFICSGDSIYLQNTWQTNEGIYYDTLVNSLGCDSIITTELTVYTVSNSQFSVSICDGDSYNFGTANYSAAGIYYDTLQTENGCDSIIVLNLSVNPTSNIQLQTSICSGDSLFLQNAWQTNEGIYYDTLVNSLGCDSIIVTELSVYPVSNSQFSASICDGDSYNFGTANYSAAGIYYDTLQTENGCDSIIVLNLSVNPTSNIQLQTSICSGDSIFLQNAWQTESDTYYDTLVNSLGCDSIITTELTVYPVSNSQFSASICEGDSYNFGTANYSAAGIYVDTLLTINGCDSIIVLNLSVNPISNIQLQASICSGDSIFLQNAWQTESDTYYDTLVNSLGCDSIKITQLEVEVFDCFLSQINICEGDSVLIGNEYYNTGGLYYNIVTTALGCVYYCPVELIVYSQASPNNIIINACEGDSIFIQNSWQTEAGIFHDTLQSTVGCDSLINTTLTFHPNPNIYLPTDTIVNKGSSIYVGIENSEYSYVWSTSEETSLIEISPTQSFVLYVTVSDEYCETEYKIDVVVIEKTKDDLIIYDIFTPNGDNVNDRLYIENLSFFPENKIKIYNRTGQLVYECENCTNENAWDGKYNGIDVPESSYYIMLWPNKNANDFIKKTISILR